MKKLFVTLALSAALVLSGSFSAHAAKAGKVENNTIIYGGHTYQLFDTSMNWDGAEAFCEHLGGHLVTITSQKEQSAINKLLTSGNKYNYWLGLTWDSDKQFTEWITGEKVVYTNWAPGEPNNETYNEDHVEIGNYNHPVSAKRTTWIDENGEADLEPNATYKIRNTGFICEWDEVVYTIQYNLNSGRQARNQIYTYTSSSAETLKKPTRAGYKFLGWYTNKNFTKKISKIKKGSKKNYVLYAKWKKK